MSDRRTFLKLLAAAAAGTAQAGPAFADRLQPTAPPRAGGIRKAVLVSMLPKERSYGERFAIARTAGFDGIEMRTVANEEEAAAIREASQKSGLPIHSVMNSDHWTYPLSSADPEVVKRSVAGMQTSLRNAKLWGADTVLLVPAVVDAATPYKDA